jgi:hypothetical protein
LNGIQIDDLLRLMQYPTDDKVLFWRLLPFYCTFLKAFALLLYFSEGFCPFTVLFWRLLPFYCTFLKAFALLLYFSEGFCPFTVLFWRLLPFYCTFLKAFALLLYFSKGFCPFTGVFWRLLPFYCTFFGDLLWRQLEQTKSTKSHRFTNIHHLHTLYQQNNYATVKNWPEHTI